MTAGLPRSALARPWLLYRIFSARLGLIGALRLGRFFIRRALGAPNPPMALMLAVTYRCQCRCVHCSSAELGLDGEEELSTAEVKSLIDQAAAAGIIKFGFTGGEPLLREDLEELVARAAARHMSVSIDTNGAGLDEETALRLKKAGVSNICVSVDSPDPKVHDRLRRLKGSHGKALAAIKTCAELSIPCSLSTYLTDKSFERGDLQKLIELSSSLGAAGVRVMFPILTGKLSGRRTDPLSAENKRRFFTEIIPEYPRVYSESPLFDHVPGGVRCSMRKGLSVYVSAYGGVRGCCASAHPLGSVRRQPLGEILRVYARTCGGLPACNLAQGD